MKVAFIRPGAWERGATLAEVLVAATLLSVLMAASYGSLVSQMRTHATETVVSETMLAVRSALGVLTEQIGAAGQGVPHATSPSPAEMLVTAEAQRLSFWSNFPSGYTYLTVAVSRNSTQLAVKSTDGLHPGTKLYVMDGNKWHFASVVKRGERVVAIDPPLAYGFAAGSALVPVEQITFELAGDKLLRNGRPVIAHVRELTFNYDAKDPREVRVIGVRLTVETRSADVQRGAPVAITVSTEVAPPNLALRGRA